MCALPSSCGLGYICMPPPSQALHRGVFAVLPSRECVSSRWQLPKVLNTLLREHCSLAAFVSMLTDTSGNHRAAFDQRRRIEAPRGEKSASDLSGLSSPPVTSQKKIKCAAEDGEKQAEEECS
ncbi:hypothetical protein D4764_17G0001840 [Takifugu flavidus]|uniref:Uncharacterized protein n=1 Tax=Takifugu flavidus TaxID=433684 RepID=A0A5C6NVT7_9TELE|nr:hypothetical protein D4764_17G0001840 [Takifugu flavidus]